MKLTNYLLISIVCTLGCPSNDTSQKKTALLPETVLALSQTSTIDDASKDRALRDAWVYRWLLFADDTSDNPEHTTEFPAAQEPEPLDLRTRKMPLPLTPEETARKLADLRAKMPDLRPLPEDRQSPEVYYALLHLDHPWRRVLFEALRIPHSLFPLFKDFEPYADMAGTVDLAGYHEGVFVVTTRRKTNLALTGHN